MSNKPSLFDKSDYGIEDFEDDYVEEAIVKKCHCGYKGSLIPDPGGLRCANCDYLLVENRRK